MKNSQKIAVAAGVVIILAIVAYFQFPTSPLSSLRVEDVAELHLFAAPPEEKVVLTQEQAAEAVALLRQLRVKQRGYAANFTTGQVIKLTVIRQDGTGVEVVSSANTGVAVNGVSYRTDAAWAEKFSVFANHVLQ